MAEDKNLEQFKLDFTEGYIHPQLDNLLDLKNKLKTAETVDEVNELIGNHRAFMLKELGIEEVKKDETKQEPTNPHKT